MKEQKKYIRLDADNVGDKIELALLQNNIETANKIHSSVQSGIAKIKNIILESNGEILMAGCDDILFIYSLKSMDFLDNIRNMFEMETGFTLSIGFGNNLAESLESLKIAKLSGKNQIFSKSDF